MPRGLRLPPAVPSTVLIAARVERLAGRLGEHPAALVPFGASMLAFVVLYFSVFGDQREELAGRGDVSAASLGLDLAFDQAAVMALRAPAGVTGAVRRQCRLAKVDLGSACVDVPAAMSMIVVYQMKRLRVSAG